MAVGGQSAPGTALTNVESWNGSSWAEVNDLNTARAGLGASASNNTSALAFGGTTGTATELWNGTSWTNQNSMATSTSRFAAAGISTSALAAGGDTAKTNTEEWIGNGIITETVD